MLRIDSLHVHYGTAHILHGINIEVKSGQIVCLLGRNGAGKSTTLKTIIGLVPKSSGEIYFKEGPIDRKSAHEVARMGVAYVPEDRRIFESLTVEENIKVAAQAVSSGDNQRVSDALNLFPDLEPRFSQIAGSLSGGQQQMLAIARALAMKPQLLLLDEPTEGLAPSLVHSIRDGILEARTNGISILLVEQNLSLALDVGDHFFVLSKGMIVFHGDRQELLAQEDLVTEHIGVGRVKEATLQHKKT